MILVHVQNKMKKYLGTRKGSTRMILVQNI